MLSIFFKQIKKTPKIIAISVILGAVLMIMLIPVNAEKQGSWKYLLPLKEEPQTDR